MQGNCSNIHYQLVKVKLNPFIITTPLIIINYRLSLSMSIALWYDTGLEILSAEILTEFQILLTELLIKSPNWNLN